MKGYKHLTPEQRADVLASFRRTGSVPATARETGIGASRVRALVKRSGLALTNKRDNMCIRNEERLREWAAEGLPLAEMARRIGTKHQLVHAFLHERSIPHRNYRGGGQPGQWNAAWKGGRMLDKTGYVLLLMPDHPEANRHGYVREHRIVMERVLGRHLRPGEVVHHKDRNRQNNSEDNLEFFDSNGQHLAETLPGRPHSLSPEGLDRIRESTRRMNTRRRAATRDGSAVDGV